MKLGNFWILGSTATVVKSWTFAIKLWSWEFFNICNQLLELIKVLTILKWCEMAGKVKNLRSNYLQQKPAGGSMGGWIEVQAFLRIAQSNQKWRWKTQLCSCVYRVPHRERLSLQLLLRCKIQYWSENRTSGFRIFGKLSGW